MARCWSGRGVSSVVLGACLWLFPGGAAAEVDPPERLDLSYEAPPECPSRSEIDELLRARLPPKWWTGADTRRFELRIARSESGGYSGRLDVRGVGPEQNVREIRAPTCRAVSTSLVLFLVIALDPAVDDVRPPPPPHAPEEPEDPTAKTQSTMAPRPSPVTGSWTWSSGYQATYRRVPADAWGGRVHAELTRSPAAAALGAALRLSWGWSDFSTFPGLAGEAKFRLRSGRLEGCARIRQKPFVVSPCAAFDIGTLSGTTPSLRPASSTTLWTAAGAIARGGVELSPWLSIELEAGVFLPFERRGFVLTEPYRSVYEPPRALFDAGAGLSVGGRFH